MGNQSSDLSLDCIALEYIPFWASLMAQIIKNLPSMQKIYEDPLEKGMASHFSILAWRIP